MTHDPLPHPAPDADAEALAERAGQLLAVLDGEEPLEPEHLADIDEALPLLCRAVVLAPHHPDLALWCRAAGWAHAVRGDISDDPADREAAVDWTRRAGAEDHPDLDPGDLALDLAHLLVLRSRTRYTPDDPGGIVELLADLEIDGPPADDGTVAWAGFAVPRGLVHLDALDAGLGVEHLERAHTLLAGAIDRLPDHAALLLDGLFAVARTSLLTDRPDPGLAAVRRVRTLGLDLDPLELDLMTVDLHEGRWDLHEDPTDLDAAITLLRGAHTARPDDRPLTCRLAERLAVRGDHHGDVADLTAAIGLLAEPGREPLDDTGEQVMAWYVLGAAHHRRWHLTGADDDRDRAEACLAELVELDPPGVGLLLDAHTLRLEALDDRARRSPDHAGWEEGADRALDAVETALARAAEELGATSHDGLDLQVAQATAALTAAALDLSLAAVNGVRVERLRRLLAIAEAHPEPPPEWGTRTSVVRATLGMYDAVVNGGDRGRAREQLTKVARETGHPDVVGPALLPLLGQTAFLEGHLTGDLTRMVAGERLLDETEPDQATTAVLARFSGLLQRNPDMQEFVSGLDEMIAQCARGTSIVDRFMEETFRRFRAMLVPDPSVLDRSWPTWQGSPESVVEDVLRTSQPLIDLLTRLHLMTDHPARRPLLDELAAITDQLPLGPQRFMGVVVLGTSWGELARAAPGDREALDEAVRWTAANLAELPGHGHPLWGRTAMSAAEARRLRDRLGDRAESRRLGLDSLRARTWTVLLQAGADEARAMARAAAGEALRVARWCAADRGHPGAAEDLVAALEAGRGLVLHAALTTRGLAGRLVDAGHAELAREWQDAGGDDLLEAQVAALQGSGLRGDLRRRVLDAVDGERTDLLTPPDPVQLRAALRAQGTDSLVYLVAGDAEHPGMAVLVPAGAPIEVLDLPRLRSGPGSPLTRYTGAYSAWRATDQDPDGRAGALQEWRAALSGLTRWAWTAAARDVLAAVADTAADPARPRLSLVAVGELALVPWHAAGPGEVPGEVVAARAIVSSTPSARMLCQVLARPRIPAGDTLIVGDPTGDLVAARTEAQALRSTFYRDATYVGRGGRGVVTAGRGSSDDVLDRLGTPHGVVHLACHAHAEPDDPARSGLRLADGDLAVADLLGHRPTQRLPLDTVLLAACSTNVSETEYDEAFSLATAFLAAGARTVFGSLWEVPDGATSELMFMVHHGLRVDGLAPAEALHRAQLWVLDPDRVRPPGMPPEPVSAGARSGERAAPHGDALAWAGFVHLGA